MWKGRYQALAVSLGLMMMTGPALAWATAGTLDPQANYRITYQTGLSSAQTMDSARITNIVEIGGRRFLEVYLSGYNTPGYIDLDSVRSILPTIR